MECGGMCKNNFFTEAVTAGQQRRLPRLQLSSLSLYIDLLIKLNARTRISTVYGVGDVDETQEGPKRERVSECL